MDAPRTVLVVDDEPMVRDLCATLLRQQTYDVLLAENGVEAVEIFQRDHHRIGLVILDLTLPRLSGDDAFRLMLRINPEVRVLFCSGYPPELIKSLGHARVFGYISKPFHTRDFIQAVRDLMEKPRTPAQPQRPPQPAEPPDARRRRK
jgi:DNA-binding NtrC family response regulator